MRRALVWVGAIIVALYALYCAVMIWLHPAFIYPFLPDVFSEPGFDRVKIANDRGPVTVYHAPARGSDQTIVYFMGNVGSLTAFRGMLAHYQSQGQGVVALAYRGGGGVAGKPSESDLKADALVAYDWAVANSGTTQIIPHGYSLGTGLATYVAANRDADGLILTAPYVRMCRLMAMRAYAPACVLPGIQAWKTDQDAPDVSTPVLISHGTDDTLIPIQEGRRLARVFPDAVEFVAMPGVGHSDMLADPIFLPGIDRFLAGLRN